MQTAITAGIRVSVEALYQPSHSKPLLGEYVFAYRITIENLGEETVRLLRRHWYIWDSNGILREVEGEGVVGEQPILHPGDAHRYVSGCPLRSEIGSMWGFFQMKRFSDGTLFDAEVPRFALIAPHKCN